MKLYPTSDNAKPLSGFRFGELFLAAGRQMDPWVGAAGREPSEVAGSPRRLRSDDKLSEDSANLKKRAPS